MRVDMKIITREEFKLACAAALAEVRKQQGLDLLSADYATERLCLYGLGAALKALGYHRESE